MAPIFTRYLYFKVEVKNSLQWSILDKQLDESLYWAYEMYFSGFKNELFEFLLSLCDTYYDEIYPHYGRLISVMYQKWLINKDDITVGTIIINNIAPKTDNVLDIYKTVVTHLISFEILVIRVVPFVIASIDIQIFTDSGSINRTVNLLGDDYLKWSIDDHYLYSFVRKNIDTIF